MINRINLGEGRGKCHEDCKGVGLVVYDHHLMKKKGYRKYVGRVYEEGKKAGTKVLAASGLLCKRAANR